MWTAGKDIHHLFTRSKASNKVKLYTTGVSISHYTLPLNTYSTRCSLGLGVCPNLEKKVVNNVEKMLLAESSYGAMPSVCVYIQIDEQVTHFEHKVSQTLLL